MTTLRFLRLTLLRALHHPWGLLVTLLSPILLTGLIGLVFSPKTGAKGLPEIRMLVTDLDQNMLSRFLTGALTSSSNGQPVRFALQDVDEETGNRIMKQGKASAHLIIPRNLTQNFLDGVPSQLQVRLNPGEQFLPAVAEGYLETTGVLLSSLRAIFSPEIDHIRSLDLPLEALSPEMLLPSFSATTTRLTAIRKVIDPLLITLEQEQGNEPQQSATRSMQSAFAQILPGMGFLFMLFLGANLARTFHEDRESGLLERILAAPVSPLNYLTGSLLAQWVLLALALLFMSLCGAWLFSIQWGSWPLHALLDLSAAWAVVLLFSLLNLIARNRRQSEALSTPVIMVLSLVGGSMVPVSIFPPWLARLAAVSPNQWFISACRHIADTGTLPWAQTTAFLIFGVLCLALSVHLLPRRLHP